MLNTSRPASLRSAGGRLALPDHPETETRAASGFDETLSSTPATSTRRAINAQRASPPAERTLPSRKRLKLELDAPKTLSRRAAATKARPAAHERPRPPTRVTVTQPHGDLLQTTNGVQTALTIGGDGVLSDPSALKPAVGTTGMSPTSPGTQKNQDKRALRSHDGGSRLKSDLAIYFSNYDDIITDAPPKPEFLGTDTPILVLDDSLKPGKSKADAAEAEPPPSPQSRRTQSRIAQTPARRSSQTAFQIIDFSTLNKHTQSESTSEDPLGDEFYFAAHRRAERKEKQLRNIEKERAMHEKVQLERLLDGLQGHDWLRVMGVSGVTDGERKDWEPKRNYFVAEVKALVDKFRLWKEEEKRLRLEKEAALHAREEGETSKPGSEMGGEATSRSDDSDAPNSSDIDASAAHQLLQEAKSASTPVRRPKTKPLLTYLPPPEPEPTEPFVSFYSKPHLRAAALGQSRHGRTTLAFGHPIPELMKEEFSLPADYLTPEALKDHARKKRRMRREISGNAQ